MLNNKMMMNRTGGIFTGLLVLLWFALFFAGMLGYFAYKQDYLRFEIGRKDESVKPIYDTNTIAKLEKMEGEISERSKELNEKEKVLIRTKNQIEIEKAKLKKDRDEVKNDLEKISAFFEKFSSQEEARLKQLSSLYESMKPDQVAEIFKELDNNTIAELLKRIKSRNAAKILAAVGQVDAARAARISDIIQGKDLKKAFKKAGETIQ